MREHLKSNNHKKRSGSFFDKGLGTSWSIAEILQKNSNNNYGHLEFIKFFPKKE